MSDAPCRWYHLSWGVVCNRSNPPGKRCQRFTVNRCTFPGQAREIDPGECLECERFNVFVPREARPLPPHGTVVRDHPRGAGWKGQERATMHLACAELETLHAFATRCGLKREWFQDGRLPHYDVIGGEMIGRVLKENPLCVTRADLVRVARACRAEIGRTASLSTSEETFTREKTAGKQGGGA